MKAIGSGCTTRGEETKGKATWPAAHDCMGDLLKEVESGEGGVQ